MNIQEIIARAIYTYDYGEEGNWDNLFETERNDYKLTAAAILVALGNKGLQVANIPRSVDPEANTQPESEQVKTNPNKGRSQH
jgi:hypothetical protein